MMNILHINLNFYESSLYLKFNEALINNGCNSDVLFPTLVNFELGNPPDYLIVRKALNKYDRYLFKYRNRKIINLIEEGDIISNYDLLHAHSLFSNGYIAYTLNRLYGIPYIVAVRNTDMNHFFKKRIFLRNIGFEILKNAKKVVFLSEPYKHLLLDKYIPVELKEELVTKIEVIPNGIDEYWHKNKYRFRKYEYGDPLNILSVGVVNKNKNILTSIKACEMLIRDKNLDVQLTVIGDVEDKKIYNEMKKYKFVKYIPSMDKNKLVHYYRNATVFLMPSINETFGLVYAEAMSQGLPVLYSKGQGFDEQFSDGEVGYAVEKRNPLDIANKILLVLDNYADISRRCLKLVDRFDWNEISRYYINLYKKIVCGELNN